MCVTTGSSTAEGKADDSLRVHDAGGEDVDDDEHDDQANEETTPWLSTVAFDDLPVTTSVAELDARIREALPRFRGMDNVDLHARAAMSQTALHLYESGRPLRCVDGYVVGKLSSSSTTEEKRTLTLTGQERMQVSHVEAVQLLMDRGELARALPALNAIRDCNAAFHHASGRIKGWKHGDDLLAITEESASGTPVAFFPNTKNKTCAVFKARELERDQRDVVMVGSEAEREAAAFLLDWGGFAGVPATLLVDLQRRASDATHRSVGSLQAFVSEARDTAGDVSPSLFPASLVHRLGILDIRMVNTDRNDSNILIVRGGKHVERLVPIDHGLCLPDLLQIGYCDVCWIDWPQTLEPFDADVVAWVAALDPEADASVLSRVLGIGERALRVFRVASWFLKKAVKAGCTLREIASVVVRTKDIDVASGLENVMERARELSARMAHNHRLRDRRGSGGAAGPRCSTTSSFDQGESAAEQLRGVSLSDEEDPPREDAFDEVDARQQTRRRSEEPLEDEAVFFAYVHRLLDDVVEELLERREKCMSSLALSPASSSSTSPRLREYSATLRAYDDVGSKLPSPRLRPSSIGSPSAALGARGGLPSGLPSSSTATSGSSGSGLLFTSLLNGGAHVGPGLGGSGTP